MPLTQADALRSILSSVSALIALEGGSGATGSTHDLALSRSALPPAAHVYPPIPRIEMADAEVNPSAKSVHVTVRLTAAPPHTITVKLLTKNGEGSSKLYEGGQFRRTEWFVTFRPGDPLEQSVELPLNGHKIGQGMFVIIPDSPNGAEKGRSEARITVKAGAVNAAAPGVRRAPRTLATGKLAYALDVANLKAADGGGSGVWNTALAHGRSQIANKEAGLYADAALHPGTRPYQIEGAVLRLRSEKLKTPVKHDGVLWEYAASVLTGQNLPATQRQHGVWAWEAMLPDRLGSWPALWLLPTAGWPPEIDVMEQFNHFGWTPKTLSNAALHFGDKGQRSAAIMSRLPLDRILGESVDLTREFHQYAVEVRPDFITWYVDGTEVFQAVNVFRETWYPLMNVAIGGQAGDPGAYDQGSGDMLIRSFRVYE